MPEGWGWCRIGDLAIVARGGSPRPIERYLTNEVSGVNWIKIGDAEQGGKYINSTKQRIRKEGVSRSRFVRAGDFLLSNSMSYGRPYILNIDGCIHDGWLVIAPINNSINKDFFFYLLSSDFAYQQFSKQASGAVVSNLNKDKVADAYIPLPPYREQVKIVKVIEAIKVWIEVIEIEQDTLSSLLSRSKEKILELAIHGKLTPQDLNDEPAIELLRRLNPAFVPAHNLHYEGTLPQGWIVCTLGEISNYGQCVSVSVDEIDETAWVLELEDIEKDTGRLLQRLTKKDRSISGIRHKFQRGQLLFSKLRTYLNKVLIAYEDGFCTTEIIPITPINGIDSSYLNLVLRSPYFLNYTAQRGHGVKMPRLGTNDARKAVIPIPPIKEQHRIVQKTEDLFSELDLITTLNNI